MEVVHVVRHKFHVEKQPIRQICREMGLSRATVRRYVRGAEACSRTPTPRGVPAHIERARTALDALLASAPSFTSRKQVLTAQRLHEMIKAEHDVGYTFVKDHVRRHKLAKAEVYVPLVYRPGDLAEVDFFEVDVDVAGVRQRAFLFVMRLMFSKRDFVWLYPRQDQVCFLDAHVRAFEHFGVVVQRALYDNLKPAVARVLVGSERKLSERFVALTTHYAFEPCFARPATGHDKGGVEARGKHIRWQSMVPVPVGDSLDDVSRALLADVERRNQARDGFDALWLEEHDAMTPLPPRAFFASKTCASVPVSAQSVVTIEGARYSVPTSWARRKVVAHVGVSEVEIVGPDRRRERRLRLPKGASDIDYARDYLAELARKPQAVRQVAHVLVKQLGEPFPQVWTALVEEHGEKGAAKHMARVLKGVLDLGRQEAARRVSGALATGMSMSQALLTSPPPLRVLDDDVLPIALRVDVQSSRAADYDLLCGGAT